MLNLKKLIEIKLNLFNQIIINNKYLLFFSFLNSFHFFIEQLVQADIAFHF